LKSARTVSRGFTWKSMSTLGLLHMVSWECCDNALQNLSSCCLPSAYSISKQYKI